MEQKKKRIEFRFGKFGKLAPLMVAAAMILWAAFSQSNVNGYVLAFFAALVAGVLFAKDEKAYGEALVYGLSKPMFGVIVMAVILAAISGKLISASGVVQTIAVYVVAAGFTVRGSILSHHLSAGVCHRNLRGDLFCGDSDLVSGGRDGRGGAGVYDRCHRVRSSVRR